MHDNPYKNSSINDQTLNKQGQVPQYKQNQFKVNPKELSNDELEYIIKTGKLPPKYSTTQQMPLQQEAKHQIQTQNQSKSAQFNNQAAQNPNKPYNNNFQAQNLLGSTSIQQTTSNSIYDNNKENQQIFIPTHNQQPLEITDLMNSKNERDFEQHMKHFSSPRLMTDYIQSTTQKQNPFSQQSLHQTHQQSIMETLIFKHNNDQSISPMNQSHQSIAATNALKALQDRVKQLEKEKQFLEDRLNIVEGQANENQMKISQKLRDEMEKACTRENQLKEENFILKKQLETVEQEKMRHLEENSNERDQWRQLHKQVEEENISLKKSLNEESERYVQIQEAVNDIKKREAQLRERYESELQSQRDKVVHLQQDMNENKAQYERLKLKLQEKLKDQQQNYEKLEGDFIQMRESRDKENQKLKRENESLINQISILKEELILFGSNQKTQRGTNQDIKTTKVKKSLKESQFTPKGNLKNNRFSSPHEQQQQEVGTKQVKSNKKSKCSKLVKRYDRNAKAAMAESQIGKNMQGSQPVRLGSTGSKYTSRVKSQASQRSASKQETGKKKQQRRKQKRSESRQPVTLEPLSNKKLKTGLLNGVQSEGNLISINTDKGKAETVKKNNFSSAKQEKYIYIDEPKTITQTLEQQNELKQGQIKRQSRCDVSREQQIDNQNLISQQSSVGFSEISNSNYKVLDFYDGEKQGLENEIFYLEREIFDYNQQYKSLLSQQSSASDQFISQNQTNSQYISQKLRQIAQQLEQKSEKLFELKKQQQQMILKESFKGKGGLNNSQRSQKQEKRSLDEIDTLLQRQEYLKQMLGSDKSKEIEDDPDLFYNHERFRIWQAKARFRAILTTAAVCPPLFTMLNNNRDGIGFMRRKWYISVPITLGTFITSFYVWHRIVGYNNQAYLEQTYAKNIKMLRNLIIKQ